MANRYQNIPTKQTNEGKRVTTSTTYPDIKTKVGDIYIITKVSDRLDSIADEFYNDPTLWWILAKANNLGKGTLVVPPGTQLVIPNSPSTITNQLDIINNR